MRSSRLPHRVVPTILLLIVALVPAPAAAQATGTAVKAAAAKGQPKTASAKATAAKTTPARTARSARPKAAPASGKKTVRPAARKKATTSARRPAPAKKPAAPVRSNTPQAPVPLTVASPTMRTRCLSRAELDPLMASMGLSQADMDEMMPGQPGHADVAVDAERCVSVALSSSPAGTIDTLAFLTGRLERAAVPAFLHRGLPPVPVEPTGLTCELASPTSVTLPAESVTGDLAELLAEVPESLRWEVGIVARRMAADRDVTGDESIRVLYTPASTDLPARLLGVERIDDATEQGLSGVWWLPRTGGPGALVGAGGVDYERLLWQSAIDYRQISRGIGNATRAVRRKVTVKNAKGERVTRTRVVRIPVAHIGVDMSAATGTPIHAVADATVAFAGRRGAFGNLVILDHGGGYQTYYAHLSAFAEDLTAGRVVSRGRVVGLVGATGRATGPHLHFEVRHDGRYVDPFDDTHQIAVWGLQPDEAGIVLLRALALRAAEQGTALPGAGCSGSDILTLN